MQVYNPDDEAVGYRFAGSPDKELPPNAYTDLPEAEARFLADTFGKFGVTFIPVGASEAEKKTIIVAAEERYVTGTRKWAEEVLVDWWDRNKSKREVGIKVDETKDVSTAKAWLKSRGFLEK